jgi:UrcA family protein
MKKIVSLAIAAAAALGVSPAAAQSVQMSDEGNYRASIPYGDLDLASPAGLKTLETRVKSAAAMVCGKPENRSLTEIQSVNKCREDLISAARPQLARATQARGGSAIALLGDR